MTSTNSATIRPADTADFLRILASATAVSIDNGAQTCAWSVAQASGECDNQVVRFTWSNSEHTFECILTEGGIAAGGFESDGTFVCDDHEGNRAEIRMLLGHRSPRGRSPENVAVLDKAIEALSPGSASRPEALAALTALRDDLRKHAVQMTSSERCPTGADYNWLVDRIGLV